MDFASEGERHLSAKRWSDAAASFSSAIGLNAEDAWLWCKRAQARAGLGELQGAEADFSTAIGLASRPYPAMFFSRGHCRYTQQRFQDAVQDFDVAIQEHSEAPAYMYFSRAKALTELGRHEAAWEDVQQALQKDPLDPDKQSLHARLLQLLPHHRTHSPPPSESLSEDMLLLRQLVALSANFRPTAPAPSSSSSSAPASSSSSAPSSSPAPASASVPASSAAPAVASGPVIDEEERQLMQAVERAERMAALRKRLAAAEKEAQG